MEERRAERQKQVPHRARNGRKKDGKAEAGSSPRSEWKKEGRKGRSRFLAALGMEERRAERQSRFLAVLGGSG